MENLPVKRNRKLLFNIRDPVGQNPNKKVQFMEVFFYTNLYALYYEISCSGFPHCNDKITGISSKKSVYFYSIFEHVMVDMVYSLG